MRAPVARRRATRRWSVATRAQRDKDEEDVAPAIRPFQLAAEQNRQAAAKGLPGGRRWLKGVGQLALEQGAELEEDLLLARKVGI